MLEGYNNVLKYIKVHGKSPCFCIPDIFFNNLSKRLEIVVRQGTTRTKLLLFIELQRFGFDLIYIGHGGDCDEMSQSRHAPPPSLVKAVSVSVCAGDFIIVFRVFKYSNQRAFRSGSIRLVCKNEQNDRKMPLRMSC